MSRPPTCTMHSHDDLSYIRQIPPAFRKWFAINILDHNAGEALQSALTFTLGIFQHPPRLHSSIFPAHLNTSSTTPSDWTFDLDDTSSSTWQHTPWPHSVFICFDDSSPQYLSSIKHKIKATTSNTPHLILAFISTSTLTWKQLRETYGATCIATIPPGCIPWGHAGGWSDVIELDKNAQNPKQTHTWRVLPEGILRAPPPHPSASMRRHSNMTNTETIYVLLFGNNDSRLPPPTKPQSWNSLTFSLGQAP